MSHLAETTDAPPFNGQVGSPVPNGGCPASSYSGVDPKLRPQPGPPFLQVPHFEDLADDQPTNRDAPFGNTFSYTLNLTDCLTYYGLTFGVGDHRVFSFWAVSKPTGGAFATVETQIDFWRVG